MTWHIFLILVVLIVFYFAAKIWLKLSSELSLFLAAVVSGLTGCLFRTPLLSDLPRHIVEGSVTYLDIILVFSLATMFMAILSESGGVDYAVASAFRLFKKWRAASLIMLMIIVLIPGALTGAGSVSLLVVGAPVALALKHLGISSKRTAAMLFILAGLSAAAPPVNIWAMILCAGTAIPYVGFTFSLGLPVVFLGVITVFTLGWKKDSAIFAADPKEFITETSSRMTWWRVIIPFAFFFGLTGVSRLWPFSVPVFGLPFAFLIAGLAALLLSPKRINLFSLASRTAERLLPLLATMVVVGILQQLMTATGVRGLFSYLLISMPLIMLFALLPVVIPVSEGILTYGAAAILGIPLVWYLDSVGYHATLVISGLSLLWPLGDGLPPTALIGRLSNIVSEYKESYWAFILSTWIPWLIITAVGMLMMIFSSKLAFLVKWSL